MKELEKCYRVYEEYIKNLIKIKKFKTKELDLKKGQAIIWAANLIHGGTLMKKKILHVKVKSFIFILTNAIIFIIRVFQMLKKVFI